jgi:nucleotide-binding universal stress UspA family protein
MAAYNVPDYEEAAKDIPRIVHFHFGSVILGVVLIAAAIAYRKFVSGASDGFPWYFIYLVCASLIPSAGFFYTARRFINWRAFSFTFFLLLLISLLWEVTLALPYGWWEYRSNILMGLQIGAWSGLPIEAVCVWLAVTFTTIITYEVIKIWKALGTVWVQFVGVILALSGAESIANLTGVMKLDRGSTMEHPSVGRESLKAITPVAIEVVVGTALLGWAMLSLPSVLGKTLHLIDKGEIAAVLGQRSEDMLRFVGEQFATATFSPAVGQIFGWIVGIVFFLLLLSAANTAIVAMIGLLYMMSRDREMPRQFRRLNGHGVPIWPLFIATGLPVVVLLFAANFAALAGLYAIGVVGAITVNVGSCTFNRTVNFTWYDRVLFGITFVILAFVELTLAHTKVDALQFVLAVLIGGLALRAYTLKLQGLTTLTVTREVARMVTPDLAANMRTRLEEGQKIMVAARGITPVLSFAMDEAQLRKATLFVLYVKEVAVYFTAAGTPLGRSKWPDDPEANAIMCSMLKLGGERGVNVVPLYAVSQDASATIVDLAATMGIDFLVIGASQRPAMAKLLRGSVATNVAQHLPDSIQLLIFG